MSTTIAEIPATENKPSPFSAALENAFKDVPAEVVPTETQKASEVPSEPKKSIPDELFKKPEAEKVAEPAASESPIDGIAEPPKLDAKGKAGWEALKKTAREEASKRAELEKQISEWKAKGRDPETLEKALSERDKKLSEYEAKVARVDLELSESFKRDIIEPRNRELGRAKALAEEIEVNPDELASALSLTGKARAAALRDMALDLDPVQSGRLGRIIEKIDEINDRATEERANAKQSLEQRAERERMERIAEQGALVKTKFLEFEDTSRALKAAHPVLNHAEGHDEWNRQADSIIQAARDAVEANPHTNIRAEIEARTASVYQRLFSEANEMVSAQEKKIAEMEAELKAIHSKSPSLSQRGGAPASAEKNKPFSAILAEAFGS
jgi:hypothetical protein